MLIQGYLAKKVIFHYGIPIGHILVPVREHGEVARSLLGENIPWEFVGATQPEQEFAADIVLGRVVEAAVLAKIPITFLRFPDIVRDEDYCWSHISPVFSDSFDIYLDRERFREEFYKLSDFSISRIQMGDGVRVQLEDKPQKPKTRHAVFQEWKKKPHEAETTPDFRRNACSLCNLPIQHPIHSDNEGGDV
ncbi:MAG: hypothetical protein ACXABD_21040 [Candidatus Thorarchaeota archaeon]